MSDHGMVAHDPSAARYAVHLPFAGSANGEELRTR